jgi:hypothetical protein
VKLYSSPCNIMSRLSMAKICFLCCHFALKLVKIAPPKGCSSYKYHASPWHWFARYYCFHSLSHVCLQVLKQWLNATTYMKQMNQID